MTINDRRLRRLTLENVNRAPRKRGVYALYADGEPVYIGLAVGGTDTIRRRLRIHLRKNPKDVSAYRREPSATPEARHKALLAEHVAAHGAPPLRNA